MENTINVENKENTEIKRPVGRPKKEPKEPKEKRPVGRPKLNKPPKEKKPVGRPKIEKPPKEKKPVGRPRLDKPPKPKRVILTEEERRIRHKEALKKYYQQNKEKILTKLAEKDKCELCGAIYTKIHRHRHLNSQLCTKRFNKRNEEVKEQLLDPELTETSDTILIL